MATARQARIEAGYSAAQVGKRLRVSADYIRKLEIGAVPVPYWILCALTKLYGCDWKVFWMPLKGGGNRAKQSRRGRRQAAPAGRGRAA